jgi:alpha-methylacyl-CoA racemase
MGPLSGKRIVEISGLGPAPFAAMLLGDMGADVIRVERPGGGFFGESNRFDTLARGKRCICIDLKQPAGREAVLRLVEGADGLLEGFRPGVMEKLGLGPDVCLARNPRLVFGRMTGWGQDGPLADQPGHDINYISLAGVLHPIGRRGEKPAIPLNLVGDFGGGGLLLAFGMACALVEVGTSGRGQMVDAAMVDGAALLAAALFGAHQSGFWSEERGTNMLDSGSSYELQTADGGASAKRHRAAVLRQPSVPGARGAAGADGPAPGPPCRSASPRSSAPRPETSGVPSSSGAAPALRRCSPCPRPSSTPTTWRGAPSRS